MPAQTVTGMLSQRDDGEPVEGAIVSLIDAGGVAHARVLSDAAGAFRLSTTAPGNFHVRVERIGFANTLSGPFALSASEVRQLSLQVSPQPVTLEGITAVGQARDCRIGASGGMVGRVWDEARKALDAVSLTQQAELLAFDIQTFRRELDPQTLAVRSEERRARFGRSDNPFASVSAEDLAEHGFVRAFPDSTVYHAPDADVLLSDEFYSTHCFGITGDQPGDESLVGLDFWPINRPSRPDIEGTLWLDRASAALRHIEYRYVGLPLRVRTDRLGGRIDFEPVAPSGAWIVKRWQIVMPRVVVERSYAPGVRGGAGQLREQQVMAALIEVGGEVVSIGGQRDAGEAHDEHVTVSGIVMDSLNGGPLRGAHVYLSGTNLSASSDAQGRYSLSGIPAGHHVISFTHPELTSLGIIAAPRPVELGGQSEVEIELATPSVTSALAMYCPGANDDTGMITGHVRGQSSGAPLYGAVLEAAWEVAPTASPTAPLPRDSVRSGGTIGTGTIKVSTDWAGFYRFCGVPLHSRVQVRASYEDVSARQVLRIGSRQMAVQDLVLEQ